MTGEFDPPDLEGNALAEKERQDEELTGLAIWESNVRWLMGNKRGRAFVFTILEDAKVFHSIFNSNALQMAHAAGQKDFAFRLLDVVNRRCPDHYTKMMQEHHEDGRTTDGTGVRTDSNSD